ncbi:hypothetical protein [Taklimakanibacter lacteus]|uniref:hypothetical protein n=1 Tax=Taklimakanibacter lacteus TaxID=2268456 RepID=UPI000E66C033
MPTKIIAVHNDASLAGDLTHATTGAAAAGYQVIPSFTGPGDLITSVGAILDANSFDCLELLEIVAHGDPTYLDDILDEPSFGASLKTVRLCDVCHLYLSGCNTAVNLSRMFSHAQLVSLHGPTVAADGVMLTVYGAKGYVAGLHMDGSEDTVGNRGVGGVYLAGYPDAPDGSGNPGVNIGSINAVGQACWRGYREGRRVI